MRLGKSSIDQMIFYRIVNRALQVGTALTKTLHTEVAKEVTKETNFYQGLNMKQDF